MLIGPVTALAQAGKSPEEAVKAKVQDRLAKSKELAGTSIEVAVEGKTVTISGSVATLAQKEKAAKEAGSAAKGYRLVNNVTVTAPEMSAQELADKVQEAFDKSQDYGIFDYVGAIANSKGEVTLQGWSYYPWRIETFGTIAKSVPGVTKVTNELQAELLNDSDRVLGLTVARLIYHSPRMRDFGHSTGAIHIIVDNSVVKLAGFVGSESEGEATTQLIRSNTAARSVVNALVVKGKENNF
jgi:osmotically-inducible protein OsmY